MLCCYLRLVRIFFRCLLQGGDGFADLARLNCAQPSEW